MEVVHSSFIGVLAVLGCAACEAYATPPAQSVLAVGGVRYELNGVEAPLAAQYEQQEPRLIDAQRCNCDGTRVTVHALDPVCAYWSDRAEAARALPKAQYPSLSAWATGKSTIACTNRPQWLGIQTGRNWAGDPANSAGWAAHCQAMASQGHCVPGPSREASPGPSPGGSVATVATQGALPERFSYTARFDADVATLSVLHGGGPLADADICILHSHSGLNGRPQIRPGTHPSPAQRLALQAALNGKVGKIPARTDASGAARVDMTLPTLSAASML